MQMRRDRLIPMEDGVVISELSSGEKIRTPQVETMAVQSTVGITSGQAVAFAGVSTRRAPRHTEFLILVSAELLDRD